MKKQTYLWWATLLLSCSWNLNATDYSKVSSEIKVQLETKTLSTPYKNILGENAQEEVNAFLEKQSSEINTSAFSIKIKYSKGLETIQYVEKREDGNYFYHISFYSPEYEVTVFDSNQVAIFEKKYEKEKVLVDYGKENKYTSSSDLSTAWRKAKRPFYKAEEAKYNNVITFLEDFEEKVLPQFIIAPKEEKEESSVQINQPKSIDSSMTDTTAIIAEDTAQEVELPQDTIIDIQEIVQIDSTETIENPVSTQTNITQVDATAIVQDIDSAPTSISLVDSTLNQNPIVTSIGEDTLKTPPIKIIDQRDLRDHNKIISLGIGLGNLKNSRLAQPVIGGSLDRYSFDDLFGVDWFFVGGWVGYGKYKFDDNGFFDTAYDMTEISFISRYGVSLTRILQDKGIASKLTQNFDVYALIQFGYSIVVAENFLIGVDTSGGRGGLAIGGRYEWKKFGVFTELGKTETGYAKAGLFLKL